MKDENLAVRAAGLTKSYQGKTVLSGLDLSVKRGTVFGLLGANGAGKSTTIECILGTRRADSGTAAVLGRDPKKERGALFQRVGVERIVARHDVNNPHSGGVMRKCGMNFEGIREKAHRNNQGVIDTAQYFIERGDR